MDQEIFCNVLFRIPGFNTWHNTSVGYPVLVWKPDPCPYLFEFLPNVHEKKTNILDTLNTDKNYCRLKPLLDVGQGFVPKMYR